MRQFLIFLVIFAFAVCTPNIEEVRAKRQNIRKEFQKQLAECILKSEGSPILKKHVEDNKDNDIRKVLYDLFNTIDANDRDVIRKCRKESSEKLKEKNRM